jgi:hypothetical protein
MRSEEVFPHDTLALASSRYFPFEAATRYSFLRRSFVIVVNQNSAKYVRLNDSKVQHVQLESLAGWNKKQLVEGRCEMRVGVFFIVAIPYDDRKWEEIGW